MALSLSQLQICTKVPSAPVAQVGRTGMVDESGVLFSPGKESSTGIKHTYASYQRESILELDPTTPASGSEDTEDALSSTTHKTQSSRGWALSLPISIPPNPSNLTLKSLTYDINYASLGSGNTFVQTDIVLSDGVKATEGIILDSTELTFYSSFNDENLGRTEGYTPPVVNEDIGLCLSSRPSFRGPDISGWCHYADHQEVSINTRLGENHRDMFPPAADRRPHLYLFFHVYEASNAKALRSIDVNIVATWGDGELAGRTRRGRKVGGSRREFVGGQVRMGSLRRRVEENERGMASEDFEQKRKAFQEWEERLSALEKRVGSFSNDEPPSSSRGKRDQAMKVGAENAIVKVLVEVQKFREEVDRYREEAELRNRLEAENWGRIVAERKAREEEYAGRTAADMVMMKELVESQKKMIREEIEQYKREEAENRAKEVERTKKRREVERQLLGAAEYRMMREVERRIEEAASEEDLPKTIHEAPRIIGHGKFEEHLRSVAESRGKVCAEGYNWIKLSSGYQCMNSLHGSHWLSFKDLGLL